MPDLPSQPSNELSAPGSLSLTSRLTNVFVSPSEVFDAVKTGKPNNANWLVPLCLSCLVGVLFSLVVFSEDTILHAMREAQERPIQKQVASGKMTREQADKALEVMEKFRGPTVMKIMGSIGAVVTNVFMMFFVALILWLLGKVLFKGHLTYMQAVETNGLATMINVVGGIITMLVVVNTGNLMITPGPALLIGEFSDKNLVHLSLTAINLVTLWYIAVLAIGLARLSGASLVKATLCLFGLWAVLRCGAIFVQMKMTGA